MSEPEFEITTPAFFYARLQALNQSRIAENEYRAHAEREAWERTRYQTWYLIQVQLEKKDRQRITDFLPFPWDEKKNVFDIEKMREEIKKVRWAPATLDENEPLPEPASPADREKSFTEFLKSLT